MNADQEQKLRAEYRDLDRYDEVIKAQMQNLRNLREQLGKRKAAIARVIFKPAAAAVPEAINSQPSTINS